MKRILMGVKRSHGELTGKDGNKVKFDNMVLTVMNFNDKDTAGFTVPVTSEGKVSTHKIRTMDFRSVVGITAAKFMELFEKKFMYHQVRIIGQQNDYDRFEIERVEFSKKTCFELYLEELEDLKKFPVEEDSEPNYFDGEEETLEDSEESIDTMDFEKEFELDKSTGEIKKKASEKVKKE